MNKNKFTLSVLLTFALWVPTLHAEDLMQIYQLALENDPTYKTAEASLQSTIEAKGIADSKYLPSLDIYGNASRFKNSNAESSSTCGKWI